MEKRELAFKLYKESNGQKPLIEIAKEIDASPGTVRGWKSRYKWDESLGIEPSETKRSVTRNVTKDATPKLVVDNEENNELKNEHELFCLLYLKYKFNATKAYQEVYGVDYKTASSNAWRLMGNDGVNKEVKRLKGEVKRNIHIEIEDLIKEYVNQFSADITDIVKVDLTEYEVKDKAGNKLKTKDGEQVIGRLNDVYVESSDNFDGSLVKKISQGKDGISVELYDKQKAMNELMKYLGGDKLREAQIAAKNKDKDGDPEIEDDGFLEALESEGEELWAEE
ncbi:terminase small subunit [Enterococcus gilvus]|uniref:terminase small subunit n=1 Tax=Enterococcus gilvus TaxID=160453 RepID=UPI00345EF15A